MDSLRDVLARLEKEGAALGHFNVANLALLKSVVTAAAEVKVPVLIGASEGERGFLGTRELAVLVRSLRKQSCMDIFLNADHTHSLPSAVEAAKVGFDAVAIDFSALPFEQNAARTHETVEAIKAINPAIFAEGEIGDIGTGSEVHAAADESSALSTPEQARQFVQATGIDALAPAVGKPARHVRKYGARKDEEASQHPENCRDQGSSRHFSHPAWRIGHR